MVYKGEDLDLRTLGGSARKSMNGGHINGTYSNGEYDNGSTAYGDFAQPSWHFGPDTAELRAGGQALPGQPIWVDDAVLKVCNQAYDLAATLGASEVGLEHLVHAMTQIEATSDALYELNIHVSSLKRETTAIIMEEFPAIVKDGKSSPLKSEEFEDLLKHAAELAYARRSPVTTADIIDTLFDMSRDNTTRPLLHRHRPDFDLRETSDPITDHASAEPRSNSDDRRHKVRVSAGSNHISDNPRIPTGVPTVTDTMQNARMDEIERAIRTLTDDMSRNRSTFGALIEELRGNYQPTPVYTRPTNGHAKDIDDDDTSEIAYLIGRMERNVESKFKELARAWSVLGDRIGALETVVEEIDRGPARPFELTPELEARLKTLTFADDRLDKVESLLSSLPQRLTEMERRLQHVVASNTNELAFDDERMIAKLTSIERLINESPDGNFELSPVISSLRDVEAGLHGIGGQLREVDSRNGDLRLSFDDVSDRQKRMEDLIEAQQALVLDLKQEFREQAGNSMVGQENGTETISAAVSQAVTERFSGVAKDLHGRMGQLEEVVKTALDRPPTVVTANGDIDTGFMTDAMTKIINNQHTLAGSIDEWRMQAREDFTAINTRIDGIQNTSFATPELPHERFNEISERLKHIQSTLPERQAVDGWTRFKMWLYGTDDWYAHSWGNGREDDRGWTAPRRQTQQQPDVSGDAMYNRNAYDNGQGQRA